MTIAKITASRDPADIISCDVASPVTEVVSLLAGKKIGAIPVLRDGKVAGIVSERDIIYCLAEQGADCLSRPVEDIMTSPVITIDSATKVDDALALMTKRRFRHFPVVDDDELVAFISIGDLVKDKIDEVEHEAAALRDYIQTA
ncbi:CBS domain-containing protein [Qipengyuania nanhaisediminis]|uniref:CBS domain-containing protein n=1 Tax=Qipengyuania nanhaisediminis TaxID=604088 RepID=UPI0038B3F21C